jgi:hypothetical protein
MNRKIIEHLQIVRHISVIFAAVTHLKYFCTRNNVVQQHTLYALGNA